MRSGLSGRPKSSAASTDSRQALAGAQIDDPGSANPALQCARAIDSRLVFDLRPTSGFPTYMFSWKPLFRPCGRYKSGRHSAEIGGYWQMIGSEDRRAAAMQFGLFQF